MSTNTKNEDMLSVQKHETWVRLHETVYIFHSLFYCLGSVENRLSRGTAILRLLLLWLLPATSLTRRVLRTSPIKPKTLSAPCWRKTGGWSGLSFKFGTFDSLQLMILYDEHIPIILQKICLVPNSMNMRGESHGLIYASQRALLAAFDSLFFSLSIHLHSRCRLSCAEALAHPWMASFTPLNRRPTKSLNKGKMRRFLAKRKWKVAHLKMTITLLAQHWTDAQFSYRCFPMMTFQSIVL